MRKAQILFFILVLSVAVFGQNQSFDGFYRISFFELGGSSPINAGIFEVKNGNLISGSMLYSGKDQTFSGTVQNNGKFTMQTAEVDGASFVIKGKLPSGEQSEKIEFTSRKVVRKKGSKQVSEKTSFGSIRKSEPPKAEAPEKKPTKPNPVFTNLGIVDTGQTNLKIELENSLFNNEWKDQTAKATVKPSIFNNTTSYRIDLDLKTEEANRKLILTFILSKGQNFQFAEESDIYYKETNSKDIYDRKVFDSSNTDTKKGSGKIEIISEDEEKMVIKLTNLRIPERFGEVEKYVQIDGYIHALKTKRN